MYREFKHLHLPSIDAEIRQFWEDEKIFEKSVQQRPTDRSFVFYEGPPSANGKPGIHHVMARTVKDLFCRYRTLQGYRVERKGGWDTHGLPIELQVEKELGITKEDIGKKISVDAYNQACRTTVMRYKDLWDDVTRKMGYWVDLDNPYITFENNYIESVWWLLQQLYHKKTPAGESYLYKGFTIQPFSPAAGTGLSSHELNMPGTYKEVTDISAIAMFNVVRNSSSEHLFDSENEDVRILAWTTTPWTLPSNVALTVGPNIEYVKVQTLSPYTGQPVSVVLAKSRLAAYFNPEDENQPLNGFNVGDKKLPYRVAKNDIPGSALVGIRYEQLLPTPAANTPALEANAFRVIPGDWVTTEDGTGVVHTAPYFGADDFRACKAAGVPFIGLPNAKAPELPFPLVDRQGKFVDEVPEFGGRFVKAEYYPAEVQKDKEFKPTDLLIALRLKEDNKAFKIEKYKHTYPHCWRTDKPVLYYPLDSWFVRASAAKERMAELNRTINWKPASTGTGRFGQWLENLQDWNLSRSRYWGVPLPIWRTEDAEEELCIGSVEQLRAEVEKAVKAGLMRENPYAGNPTPDPSPTGKGDVGATIVGYGGNVFFKTDSERWKFLKNFVRANRKNPTPAEGKMWEALRDKRFHGIKFRRQHAIEDFIADFVSLEYCLVVEIDGDIHDVQPEYDQYRTEYLEACGYRVFRLTNKEVLESMPESLRRLWDYVQALEKVVRKDVAAPTSPLPVGEGSGVGLPHEGIDLHRPYIDDIILVSPSGKPMRRELDLIDVWFDSGSMPYAQWHYPFENQEVFKNNFPADFIAEGVDQTRGWFYTLHAIATMVFDSVAFKNVVSNGLVLDKEGNKMSKSKGNVVDPFLTIEEHGADATRWYMMANANPWDNLKFNEEGITEVRNKLFGTLYNTYNFFALYANLDGFRMDEQNVLPYERRTELDRWVISKLYSLVADYHAAMDDYDVTRACRAIEDFVDEHLSNWYVRLSRRRFWKGSPLHVGEGSGEGPGEDKMAAYQTLFECLLVTGQLMASVAPHFADWLYRNLTAPIKAAAKQKNTPLRHDSVHLTDLTLPDPAKVDPALEKRMDYAQRICSLALSIRKKEKLRVRLPLQKILLPVLDEAFIAEVDGVKDLILSEINVKQIEYITDATGLLKKGAKANFKTLGAKLGKDMKAAAELIANFTNEEIGALEKTGAREIVLNGNAFTLTPDDMIVSTEDLPGWKTASDGELTVALDVTLTPELLAEGTARDLVNRIQNIRKDKDFNVTDRVVVTLERHPALRDAVGNFRDYIKAEVLATDLVLADVVDGGEKIELEEDVLVNVNVIVDNKSTIMEEPMGSTLEKGESQVKVFRLWQPITFTQEWAQCDTSILDDISDSWLKQREKLQDNSEEYKAFLERLKREHAIETGIVERMYDLSAGITEAFINDGFRSSLLSHTDTNIEPQTLMQHLNDHLDAVNWVFDIIKDNRPFSVSMVKQLHQLVTRHQDTAEGRDAFGTKRKIPLLKGKFKEWENNPTRADGTKILYCPPEHVDSEMDTLVDTYNRLAEGGGHPLILSAWVHHAFTTIHPFQDGNGRVARLLASLILVKAGFFPLTVLREEAKAKYIEALEKADNGVPQPFVSYLGESQKRNIQTAMNVQEVSASSFEAVQEALIQKIRTQKQAKSGTLAEGRRKIFAVCDSYLQEVEQNLKKKYGKDVGVFLGKSSFDDDSFYPNTQRLRQDSYFGQIISYAQKHNYYFNRSLPKAWFVLGFEFSKERKYHVGITIHHFGYEDGALAIGTFLEQKSKHEEEDLNIVLPLAIPPHVVSAYSNGAGKEANIRRYLQDTLTAVLAQIASEL